MRAWVGRPHGQRYRVQKRKDKRESLANLNDISIENFTDGMTGTIIAGGDDFDDEEAQSVRNSSVEDRSFLSRIQHKLEESELHSRNFTYFYYYYY